MWTIQDYHPISKPLFGFVTHYIEQVGLELVMLLLPQTLLRCSNICHENEAVVSGLLSAVLWSTRLEAKALVFAFTHSATSGLWFLWLLLPVCLESVIILQEEWRTKGHLS